MDGWRSGACCGIRHPAGKELPGTQGRSPCGRPRRYHEMAGGVPAAPASGNRPL